jgi:hypothetical protein
MEGRAVGNFRNLSDNTRIVKTVLNWTKPVGVERGVRT